MKTTTNFSTLSRAVNLVLMLLLAATTFSCSNDDLPKVAPTLSGISPKRGPMETNVIISGTDFGTDKSVVKVFFNEKEAEVKSVNEIKITAVVPKGAGTGVVKVVVNENEITGDEFEYVLTVAVTTFAGGTRGEKDGQGTAAEFLVPQGIAVDNAGNIYVAEGWGNKVRKISPDGMVNTWNTYFEATAVSYSTRHGVAVDASGTVYVGDAVNYLLRKITPEGVVSTLAGSTAGFVDGNGEHAKFNKINGLTVDADGNVYVIDVDLLSRYIRKVTPDGTVTTIAGGASGYVDGVGTSARFRWPTSIAIDASGVLYITDTAIDRIRKITPDGMVTTFAGGDYGYVDGAGVDAKFDSPDGIAVDAEGNVYVSDTKNNKIRKITADAVVTTLAGSSEGFLDGTPNEAKFYKPTALTIDADGSVYVIDSFNYGIRKITQE